MNMQYGYVMIILHSLLSYGNIVWSICVLCVLDYIDCMITILMLLFSSPATYFFCAALK